MGTITQKIIDEAIARGIGGSPKREPQQYRIHPNSPMDVPVARRADEGWTHYPLDYKGEMEFERMMKYESYPWSLLIRRTKEGFMVMTLNKQEFVRGHVVTDDFGEPKYLILNPSGSSLTALLYTIKLDGEMFTNQQKKAWTKKERSTKIAKLQLQIEGLKNEIQDSRNDLKIAEETIGDLKTENEELTKTLKTSIHEKLKKLLLHEKTEKPYP